MRHGLKGMVIGMEDKPRATRFRMAYKEVPQGVEPKDSVTLKVMNYKDVVEKLYVVAQAYNPSSPEAGAGGLP